MTIDETKKILQKLHLEITKDYLVHLFDKYDKDKNNTIDLNEFYEIIADITQKKEIIQIFKDYSSEASKIVNFKDFQNAELMTEEELLLFFKNCQKEAITMQEIRSFILFLRDYKSNKSITDIVESSSLKKELFKISISEFSSILFSVNNKIFIPEKEEIYQVTYYFFNSANILFSY